MPAFPSLDWCHALVQALESDPSVAAAAAEWGGRSVGVVIGRDRDLARDFCIYARPHATLPKLLELRECEDEDDLEIEEPDYLFRAPFSTFRQLLERRIDPVDVLLKGQVRVVGDLQPLVAFGTRHRLIGERAIEKVQTVFVR